MTIDQIAQIASIFGVAIPLMALAWSAVTFVRAKREELRRAEYQKFFDVMDHLGREGGSIASKLAAAFELRRFPQYTDVIVRLCENAKYNGPASEMLKDEMIRTAQYLKSLK